ncbi:hypothetical protein QM797_16625 [Rhodococcus sp. IEGM 1381]|uniref:hypothetical protein n=1 Tax=Rhodococcus sp. IEGM 1381 TaxID=3047085 RepID=UPI0024B82E8E|nr:hypothetical protein [Rhodococcus sp. IEGM 1381]MDI9896352.1 hypothetical protein [Rhodococcus sp. IEGM 1381]
MNSHELLNDHQILTVLIGAAANVPAEDPRAARWVTEALALASAAELRSATTPRSPPAYASP